MSKTKIDNTTDIITYVKKCFSTFEEMPFNQIDAAVFSVLSYIYLHEEFSNNFSRKGMAMGELMRAEYFESMCSGIPDGEKLVELIYGVVASPRYRNVRIKYYRNELDTDISLQFSGVVYSISDECHVVAFRGTDKSFVGWKEDMLLLMTKAASAQMMAVNYLNGTGAKLHGEIIVVGHSKGGNLAAYAAAHCKKEVQDRIVQVYSLDGPGFSKTELMNPGMLAIKDRITKIIPVASPIGVILRNETDPIIINSTNSGVMQHTVFSWVINGNKFDKASSGKTKYKRFTKNINNWAESVSDEEILLFADSFFGIFESEKYRTYDELGSSISGAIKNMIKSLKNMDSSKRKKMVSILKEALTGKEKNRSAADAEDLNTFGIDWEQIEHLMNNVETKQFNKDYDLFL